MLSAYYRVRRADPPFFDPRGPAAALKSLRRNIDPEAGDVRCVRSIGSPLTLSFERQGRVAMAILAAL
jgi:hypothetical protein